MRVWIVLLAVSLPALAETANITVDPTTTYSQPGGNIHGWMMSGPECPSVEAQTTLSAMASAGPGASIKLAGSAPANNSTVYIYGDGTYPTESTTIIAGGGTTTITANLTSNHLPGAVLGLPLCTGQITADPAWPGYKSPLTNQLVNQLGINTFSVTMNIGLIENNADYFTGWVQGSPTVAGTVTHTQLHNALYTPVNDNNDPNAFSCDPRQACLTSWAMTELDYPLNALWDGSNGMREAILKNGETPRVMVAIANFNHNTNLYPLQTPAEFGEMMLALYIHMLAFHGYGYDYVEPIVEPDNNCDTTQYRNSPSSCQNLGNYAYDSVMLGEMIAAAEARLNAAGYYPIFFCCGTTNASHTLTWEQSAKTKAAIGGISFHMYGGSNTDVAGISAQATADGVMSAMTECDTGGVDGRGGLFPMIENGNISLYLKYAGASALGSPGISSDYLYVSNTSNYASGYVSATAGDCTPFGLPAWYFPQVMHYVRDGAIREKATVDNSDFDPIAYRNKGLDTVIVRVGNNITGNQTINVTGVAPGKYDCLYTYNNATFEQSCGTLAMTAGGTITANLPNVPRETEGTTTAIVTMVQTNNTVTFAPLSNVVLGVAPFTITATASSGLQVSFTSNTPAVCTVLGDTVTIVALGTCSITASQTGNANYPAATPVTQTFQVGLPEIMNVENAATFQTTLAPSTYAVIFGQYLSTTNPGRVWAADDFTQNSNNTFNMPIMLDGTSVTIGGVPAFINYISPAQLNIITPPGVTGRSVPVVVKVNGLVSAAFNITLQTLAPSFFTWQPATSDSGKYLIAQHADYARVGKIGLFPDQSADFTTPASPGETIILYGTGFGPTTPPIANGIETDTVYPLIPTPTATFGGEAATVVFAGLVPPLSQIYQFDVTIPSDARTGDSALVVTVNGTRSFSGLITVQQ